MTLTELVQELKESTKDPENKQFRGQLLIKGRINIPEGFKTDDNSISFDDMNYGGEDSRFHLLVSGLPIVSLDEVQPILEGVMQRAKKMDIAPKSAIVEYGVFWTPEDFQVEDKLSGLYFGDIKIVSRTRTFDTDSTRVGYNGEKHELKVNGNLNKVSVKATGNYKKFFDEMAIRLNPNIATIRLNVVDAEKLKNKVSGVPLLRRLGPYLERELKPKQTTTLRVGYGGFDFNSQEQIGITIPFSLIEHLEKLLAKPLLTSRKESRVEEIVKTYGPVGLLRGKKLKDLQGLAKMIPELDLGIMYDSSVITNSKAVDLLNKEIEQTAELYRSPNSMIKGPGVITSASKLRRGLLDRLVSEHFGEISEQLFESLEGDENTFLGLLKGMGYQPVEFINPNEIFLDKWEFPYFHQERKEKHLFEFFKQSYWKDSGNSIQAYRKFYQNPQPEFSIDAVMRNFEASHVGSIKFPTNSRLYSFEIKEHMVKGTPFSNDIVISRLNPTSDDIHFWSRTSVDSPTLLPLQEYACAEMGITFT